MCSSTLLLYPVLNIYVDIHNSCTKLTKSIANLQYKHVKDHDYLYQVHQINIHISVAVPKITVASPNSQYLYQVNCSCIQSLKELSQVNSSWT